VPASVVGITQVSMPAYPGAQPSSTLMLINQFNQQTVANFGAGVGESVGQALWLGLVGGYGKRQELQADALSIRYLHQAGYDPAALVRVFNKFLAAKPQMIARGSAVSHLASDNPGLARRIRVAQKRVDKLRRRAGR
jgi:predicted Zn-dependent protease